ncbi:MAG: hypothetical protein J6U39_03555 [Clostridia bacterium]|nr:hypothetical protein [Clostridia bacterium]
MTDVTAIIDELAKELLGKKNFFGKCYVEENKVTSLLSRLREAIPQSVYEAKTLLDQRDAVIADASRRAEQIIANANETRDRLVHESEVLSIAKKQAADIEKATQDYCEKLRISVHQSLDNQLYDIAVKMNELMLSIEKLRDELWKRSGGGGQNSDR